MIYAQIILFFPISAIFHLSFFLSDTLDWKEKKIGLKKETGTKSHFDKKGPLYFPSNTHAGPSSVTQAAPVLNSALC